MKKININIYTIILCLVINIITIGFYHYLTYDKPFNINEIVYSPRHSNLYENINSSDYIKNSDLISFLAICKGVQGLGQNLRFYDIENDIYYDGYASDQFILKEKTLSTEKRKLYEITQNHGYFLYIVTGFPKYKSDNKGKKSNKEVCIINIIEITGISK